MIIAISVHIAIAIAWGIAIAIAPLFKRKQAINDRSQTYAISGGSSSSSNASSDQ